MAMGRFTAQTVYLLRRCRPDAGQADLRSRAVPGTSHSRVLPETGKSSGAEHPRIRERKCAVGGAVTSLTVVWVVSCQGVH